MVQNQGLLGIAFFESTAFIILLALFLLFRRDLFGIPIYKLGLILTGIAAILTLWSMVLYLRLAWPELRDSSRL